MLDEPSLLIAESCCSKERFLYSYLKPLENPQTGNGDTSKSYCYMTKASCKTTHIIWLTELKMNIYYLRVNKIYLKMFSKKLEEYIQVNHRYFDKDEREILLLL